MPTRPPKKSREQNGRETREAILNAALRVVASVGYNKSSVSRITQLAGVAQGSLYSYFDSHQKLLDQLLPFEGSRLRDTIERRVSNVDDFFEHETSAFTAFFEYLKKRPHFLRVSTEAEIAAPQSYARQMQNTEDQYVEALRRAAARGEVRPCSNREFRVIANILTGARGHIAIGFGSEKGNRIFSPGPLPDWVAGTYAKFLRHGVYDTPAGGVSVPRLRVPRRRSIGTDMRLNLLESAARVVYESGFAGTTILAITSAAKVAVGTFYSYFGSRQELFDELLIHMRTDMLSYVTECVHDSRSFAELDQRGFYGFFDYIAQNPWYIRIETEAAVWAPEAYVRHFHDLADRYVASMRRSKANGELSRFADRELQVLAYIQMAARHYLANRFVLANSASKRLPGWVGATYVAFASRGLGVSRG